ncbi:hypothetical protein [Streptomyces malaysiensis]|uniref:hypothetical protein n=1 Tax=Streptomyces malaysiensis TaxID=92644 RepID=UPI000BFD43FA|nr:hypothetical protein [Streptomyces malaysiensis]ATL82732.1 hypothetical protein SMALA_2498 [Streptomyces malaysiensis]QDL73021.1 hypothetical protein DNK48_30880 [Streptomyces malaysiensis]
MTTTRTLPWTPPNTEDIEPLPVGEWWDAISAPTTVADRALELLGGRSGAVIQDDTYGKTYWLIGIDTARSWCIRQIRLLTALADETTLLGVPPVTWGPEHRTHWRIPLGPNRYLTGTDQLARALRQAVNEVLGPAPDGRQLCHRCQLPTDEPVPIAIEHTGSVAAATTYACPTHARHHPRDTVAQAAAMRRALDQGRTR